MPSLVWNTVQQHRVGERSKIINNSSVECEYWPFGKGHHCHFTGVGGPAALVGWWGCLMGHYFCRAWTPLRPISQKIRGQKKQGKRSIFHLLLQTWGCTSGEEACIWYGVMQGNGEVSPGLCLTCTSLAKDLGEIIVKVYSSNHWILGRISHDKWSSLTEYPHHPQTQLICRSRKEKKPT